MPLYFVDTDDGDQYMADEDGYDLPGPEAARQIALDAMADMARDKIFDGDQLAIVAVVKDDVGTVLYRATLSMHGEWIRALKTSAA